MAKGELPLLRKPEDYQAPTFEEVNVLLEKLRKQRQPVIDRIWENKKALRGEWEDVIRHIPSAYRKNLLPPDLPQLRDMVHRISGLVRKQPPMFEVTPPSPHQVDVRKAAKEEMRLSAVRLQVTDQQTRDPHAMGIDAQISWGESWLSIWPDPKFLYDEDYERGEDESAEEYVERYKKTQAMSGIPICIQDHDPQTVFPFESDRDRLAFIIIETQHEMVDIEVGMGYRARKDKDGKVVEWLQRGGTLGTPYLADEARMGHSGGVTDPTHDRGLNGPGEAQVEYAVKKIIFCDPWTYCCFLDGILVEKWEHNFGMVPFFKANGGDSSDRDPAYATHSVLDPALTIAKNIVYFSAVLASNAMQHGFPTPFLKNPMHGLIHPQTGEPLTRTVRLGEMNLLGPNEEIEFPFLNAEMMPDFFRYMESLTQALEQSTLTNFAKAVGTEMAGYAIAQVRAMQLSILSPVYTSAAAQWRQMAYFIRHLIRTEFPEGIYLRGAIEEDDDGVQYRPILRYGKDDCTDFAINVHIDEGIQQDEMAMNKMALEMKDGGLWSRRRAMEKTGVEDPAAEADEIHIDRLTSSPAYDEIVLRLAVERATERLQATRQEQSSPFHQALERKKQEFMGGGGQFQNQGGNPVNANAAGQPLQQAPGAQAPQQGGPMAGAQVEGIDLNSVAVPQIPGGVRGGQPLPAGGATR